MKVALEVKRSSNTFYRSLYSLKASKPFVKSKQGVLLHRPRRGDGHKMKGYKLHVSIENYCGTTFTGPKDFIDTPGEGDVVCARCEDRAIEFGKPSSSMLAGRHVCTGGVKAVKRCCT